MTVYRLKAQYAELAVPPCPRPQTSKLTAHACGRWFRREPVEAGGPVPSRAVEVVLAVCDGIRDAGCGGGVPNEFAYWIAIHGQAEEIFAEHTRDESGACGACGLRWPCGTLLRAKEAATLRLDPRPVPERIPHVTVWRCEAYRQEGPIRRGEWLSRAEYPNLDLARSWLEWSLKCWRGHAGPGHAIWGEVTAGQFHTRIPESNATVLMLGDWRPQEERGATATACVHTPDGPILWRPSSGTRTYQ